jgi:hypothetical protein
MEKVHIGGGNVTASGDKDVQEGESKYLHRLDSKDTVGALSTRR